MDNIFYSFGKGHAKHAMACSDLTDVGSKMRCTRPWEVKYSLLKFISFMNILLKLRLVCIVINPHFLVTQDLVLDYRPAAKEANQQSRKEWKTKLVFIFYSPK